MAQLQRMYPDIENGVQQHEELPLNRLNSTTIPETTLDCQQQQQHRHDDCNRKKIRDIFDMYDEDHDGSLDIKEMKKLIKNNDSKDLPKGIARQILNMADENGDGKLDFEEFYKMSLENSWLFQSYVTRYCKLLVPSPHRQQHITSTTGQIGDEIDGQYEKSMSCCPPPLTMVVFSIIEIIIYLIDLIHEKDISADPSRSVKGPAAVLFIYNPKHREEAWRFITYMFVHVGIMHIAMNLIVQIFLGVALELVHSWWRVSLVYLAGVLAGSMGTSISDPNIYLAGASGGVYALITAHIATIILNYKEMEYAAIQLFVFLLFCSLDLGTSIYNHLNNVDDKIGYIAHLSGAVAGLLVGIGVLRNLEVRSWEKILWWCAVTFYFLLMFTGICIHIFAKDYFPKR